MNVKNMVNGVQKIRFVSFYKNSILLKHHFINIVDVCSCFILLTQPFTDKINLFHSIFISFILSSPKIIKFQIICFAFLFTMVVSLLEKNLVPLKASPFITAPFIANNTFFDLQAISIEGSMLRKISATFQNLPLRPNNGLFDLVLVSAIINIKQ